MRSATFRRVSVSPQLEFLPVLSLTGGVFSIGGAFYFEKIVGLHPCELCLTERLPWYALIAVSLVLLAVRSSRLKFGGALLITLLLLASTGLAAYHVAVEQHWIAGPSACTGQSLLGRSAADAVKALMATPVIRCDDIQWQLFGVSLAGWNMLASLGLACVAIAAWSSQRRTRTRLGMFNGR